MGAPPVPLGDGHTHAVWLQQLLPLGDGHTQLQNSVVVCVARHRLTEWPVRAPEVVLTSLLRHFPLDTESPSVSVKLLNVELPASTGALVVC